MEHHFEARAMLPPILDVCVAAFCFANFQLNRKFTKIILPNSEKSKQLNIGRKIFEEIFKKGHIFALPAGYSLEGYEKPLYLTTE